MSEKHLKRTPTDLRYVGSHGKCNDKVWYYEDRFGLTVVADGTMLGYIPWRQVEAALARWKMDTKGTR